MIALDTKNPNKVVVVNNTVGAEARLKKAVTYDRGPEEAYLKIAQQSGWQASTTAIVCPVADFL